MTYNKPEIRVLGDAVSVIQNNKPFSTGEAVYNTDPAYELDE